MILAWHRSNQTSKRLHYIPGVGPMLLHLRPREICALFVQLR
jgi:hypothetical protein